MRTLSTLALLAALVPAARLVQDPAPEPPEPPEAEGPEAPERGPFEAERARLEQAIQGAWMLQRYDPPTVVVTPENVHGMAIFQDGFLSLNVMARSFVPEFLGDGVQLFVQGGGHRYRINDFLELQTASIVGFQNFDDEDVMAVEAAGTPREYRIEIDEEAATLRMIRANGTTLIWSRLTPTDLPADSLEYLERVRGK